MEFLSEQDLEWDVANNVLLQDGDDLTEEESRFLPENVKSKANDYCKVIPKTLTCMERGVDSPSPLADASVDSKARTLG